jgi:hypothetical protein
METITKDTKQVVKFKDTDKNQFIIEIGFTFENGFKELTFSGQSGSGCGQCYDSIKPKNEAQERLIKLWNKYHLNGMSAGTPEQEEFLIQIAKRNKKKINDYDYDRKCRILKANKLFTVKHPETGESFKYGHSWYRLPLPDDIEIQIDSVIEDINEIEEEERGEELIISPDKQEDENYLEDYDDEVIALALHLELTMIEIEEIEDKYGDSPHYSYAGTNYLVGEYDDLVTIAEESLTQEECFWQEAVKAGNTTKGLQEWAEEVVEIDGVGHILNGWDGSEHEQRVHGTSYTIVQN